VRVEGVVGRDEEVIGKLLQELLEAAELVLEGLAESGVGGELLQQLANLAHRQWPLITQYLLGEGKQRRVRHLGVQQEGAVLDAVPHLAQRVTQGRQQRHVGGGAWAMQRVV
jgi:hypothetical protein